MPFLVSFMVDFPPEASSGVNYFVESLPPLLAPNLEDLQLSYLDRSFYEPTTLSWSTLIKFQAPFDAPEDVFRVLTLGPNLTHCSVSRIERHHLHSLAFTSSSILSLSSPWCIAPIITHQLIREFSCSWPNLTSASSSLASIFTRLSLPSLVDLTICSYDPIPLSSLITFLRRSGQGLKKLNLSFKQNTEDRMLSTIFKETPELKELVLDRLQEIEIQQLSDKYLGLLPELEILQVAESDDSPLLLDMVHTLVERRMMVDVEEEGKVVAKPQGKLNRFIFQKGYSRKLRRKILPESLEWRAGIMLQKQAEKLVNILETTPITDQVSCGFFGYGVDQDFVGSIEGLERSPEDSVKGSYGIESLLFPRPQRHPPNFLFNHQLRVRPPSPT
ncbi:hypothetical protein BDN72DRAFT_345146 [Pluteus cervinus]|uniref:Uncharacterized protein n=1 Tax=Pluteus cervinus TaxID=181527 RepID=A0ACD3B2W0_9AGAR|nr:hypothetical protein BDN72DRAFT_345146 [Pluteus cervinus]